MTLRELIEEVAKRNPTDFLETEIQAYNYNAGGTLGDPDLFEIGLTKALAVDNPDDNFKTTAVGIVPQFTIPFPHPTKAIVDSPTTPQNIVRLELFDENGNSEFILDRGGETFEETKEIMGKAIDAVEERSNESA